MTRRLLIDYVVYLIVRVLVCVIQALHIETCQTLARGIAFLAGDLLRIRGKVIEENLRHVYPHFSDQERKALTRRMWEHLVLLACEVAHAPRKIHETNYRQYFSFERQPEVLKYLLGFRPVVIVTGHFGNFEVGGYVLGLLGFPAFTIARPLDNPFLNRWVNSFRSLKGQYLLPKDGSAKQVDRILKSGGMLSLLCDQHAGDKGCWVEFLGRPASCHKALAVFTLVGGAPQIVMYNRRRGGPLRFEIGCPGIADPSSLPEELASVRPLTQWYNRRMEEVILENPEQYWWLHRRWKEPPLRARLRAAA